LQPGQQLVRGPLASLDCNKAASSLSQSASSGLIADAEAMMVKQNATRRIATAGGRACACA